MSETLTADHPHYDLLVSKPAGGTQQHLHDYQPQWPAVTHSPDTDIGALSVMSTYEIDRQLDRISVGSILTLNTVLQAKVVEAGVPAGLVDTLTAKSHSDDNLTAFTAAPLNPPLTDNIYIVFDSGYPKQQRYTVAHSDDTDPTSVEHLAVYNEHNLPDEVNTEVYTELKRYSGSTALKLSAADSGEATPGRQLTVGTVTNVRDGNITITYTGHRSETLTVSDGEVENTFIFGGRDTTARPQILRPTAGGLSLTSTFPEEQRIALSELCTLANGTYHMTADGVSMLRDEGEYTARVAIRDGHVAERALNMQFDDPPRPDVSPANRSAPSPTDPITEITGIGPATAATLSGAPQSSAGSTDGQPAVRAVPESPPSDPDKWPMATDTTLTPVSIDAIPQAAKTRTGTIDSLGCVRKLPADEIPEALQEAQKEYTETKTTEGPEAFDTVQEFVNDRAPLSKTPPQYFIKAVGDLRAYIKTHADRHNLSPEQALLLLHASSTVGRLFDETGAEIGKAPNLLFSPELIHEVAGVEAWMPASSPLPKIDTHPSCRYVLYECSADGFTNGEVELGSERNAWEPPSKTIPVADVDYTTNAVTFRQGHAQSRQPLHTTVPAKVVKYIATLVDTPITDSEFLDHHVTMAEGGSLFVESPDMDLTFAVVKD